MTLFTIGFTHKSAEEFFDRLSRAGVKRLVDVRLNNSSQLAGFTKKEDLAYFLRTINGIEYVHLPLLAPIQELLQAYKKKKRPWSEYESDFLRLMTSRRVEENVDRSVFSGACLLCSEDAAEHCHRRLVAEYLRDKWEDVQIRHL
jgi:uncharacterized protein (DUF488 family)